MPLLGTAAIAMWWDVAPEMRAVFEDWHAHEHFPERLAVPGFRRGSRWTCAAGDDSFFVLYELAEYEVLTSAHYRARLNAPTPWSVQMMPHHRNMVRSQCKVLGSHGVGLARAMLTLRLSPSAGREEDLSRQLAYTLAALPVRPGIVAAHLLKTQTPAAPLTAEQQIRGGSDAVADWVVLVSGYDLQALAEVQSTLLGPTALTGAGAQTGQIAALYELACALTAVDVLDA